MSLQQLFCCLLFVTPFVGGYTVSLPPAKGRVVLSSAFVGRVCTSVVTPLLHDLLHEQGTIHLTNYSTTLGIFTVNILNGQLVNVTAGTVDGSIHATNDPTDSSSQALHLALTGTSALLQYDLYVTDVGHRHMQSFVGNATSSVQLTLGAGTTDGGVTVTVADASVVTSNVQVFANTSKLGGIWREVERLLETSEGQALLNGWLDKALDDAGAPYLQAWLTNETDRFLPPVFPLNTTAGQVLDLAVAAVNDTTPGFITLDLTANVHLPSEAACPVPRSHGLPTVNASFSGFLLALDESAVSCALPSILAAVTDTLDGLAARLFTQPAFTVAFAPNGTTAADARVNIDRGAARLARLPFDVSFARQGKPFLVLGASLSAGVGVSLARTGGTVNATVSQASVVPSLVVADKAAIPSHYLHELHTTFGDAATLANFTAALDDALASTVLPALSPSLTNMSTHLPHIVEQQVEEATVSLEQGRLVMSLVLRAAE